MSNKLTIDVSKPGLAIDVGDKPACNSTTGCDCSCSSTLLKIVRCQDYTDNPFVWEIGEGAQEPVELEINGVTIAGTIDGTKAVVAPNSEQTEALQASYAHRWKYKLTAGSGANRDVRIGRAEVV